MKNILAISGSEDFLRLRALRGVIAAQVKKQWNVFEVDAAESGGISPAFNHAALTGGKTLAIVSNPDKDLPAIEQHLQSGDAFVILLLHYEGDPKETSKFGKFLTTLGSDHHKFSVPVKVWEQEAAAESFCVAEAKAQGLKMEKTLAQALVEYIGPNIGTLSFEMLKVITLAKSEDLQEVTKDVIRKCLGTVAEGGIQQVSDALASRNAKRLSRALTRFVQTYKDPKEAIMLVCRVLESRAYSWLPIIGAREKGMTPQQAAEASGINVWFYVNKLHPQTVKWNTPDTLRLIQELATSERSLVQGALNPWAALTARLLSFCTG